MKFLLIFISLLMITFGGLFSYVYSERKNAVREKVGYDLLDSDKQEQLDKLMSNGSSFCAVIFMIGVCLFIASLFLK